MPITFKRYRTSNEPFKGLDIDIVADEYGISPAMQALPLIKAINDLPADERMKAAAAYVEERLADPNDEWWD